MGRPGDAVVLPRGRSRRRVRVALRNALGRMAVHPGTAPVPAGVLVPRGVDRRAARGEADPRPGVCSRPRTRGRRAPVVPRRVLRRARIRACPDTSADRLGARRRGRVAPRRGDSRGCDSIRRRHTDLGCRQLPLRLAHPRGDRGRIRPLAGQRARGARRGRTRPCRASDARRRRHIRRLSRRHRGRTHLERVAADTVARAAVHVDVVRVRRRRRSHPTRGRATLGSGAWWRWAMGEP